MTADGPDGREAATQHDLRLYGRLPLHCGPRRAHVRMAAVAENRRAVTYYLPTCNYCASPKR